MPETTLLTYADAHPPRNFTVDCGTFQPTQLVQAHIPRVTESGALEFLFLVEDAAWTVRVFAAGTWTNVSVLPPTVEEVKLMQRYNEEKDAQLRAQQRAAFPGPAGGRSLGEILN